MEELDKLTVEIRGVEEIWKSPDGERTLFDVTTDKGVFKTYSTNIAGTSAGESLDVEAGARKTKRGSDMFITLPKRDDWVPQSSNGSSGSGGGSGGSSPAGTPRSMILSYAKDLYVAAIESGELKFDDFNLEHMFNLADSMMGWCENKPAAVGDDTPFD